MSASPFSNRPIVDLTHGSGGRAMAQLIEEIFLAAFDNDALRQKNDQAILEVGQGSGRLAFTTDSYVIAPIFFPGGDIGSLAVNGTINDLAMGGAAPLCLSAAFILEEGFPIDDLRRVVSSAAAAARSAGVPVVTGDTKVVERGKGDGVFVTTSGIGIVPADVHISADRARVGDRIIASGTMGDHGAAIMTTRHKLSFGTPFASDTAPLHDLVRCILSVSPAAVHAMRDPTRGGLATTLNEIAAQSRVGMVIEEACIPIRPEVRSACEFLGLDPLYVANEGKLIAICPEVLARDVVSAMNAHPLGRDAAIIGRVVEDSHCLVQMRTAFGGRRIVQWLSGEQLPRIC